ncbi:hypothetical protein LCGC14_1307360 [marine sediment metagenome]|uniref:Uncharacterized protein n=1 Tax=marine sediment metagenome TaxID=412755 RepID=A0A0F9NQT0_9ZZZZ
MLVMCMAIPIMAAFIIAEALGKVARAIYEHGNTVSGKGDG